MKKRSIGLCFSIFLLLACTNKEMIVIRNIEIFIHETYDQLESLSSKYNIHRDIMNELSKGYIDGNLQFIEVVTTLDLIKNKSDAVKIAEIVIPSFAEKKRGECYYVDALEYKNLWIVGFIPKPLHHNEEEYDTGVYVVLSRHTCEVLLIWY